MFALSSLTELEACASIAARFPEECGACHPETCPTVAPLTGKPTQFPTFAPTVPNNVTTTSPTTTKYCGCNDCAEYWNNPVDSSTCGDRILNDQRQLDYTEEEACQRQAEQK